MSKLLPCLFMLIVVICVTGSVDVPYMPQPQGDTYIPLQGVCSAPPSLFPMLCDQFPALLKVPGFIRQSEDLIEARLPGIFSPFPAEKGPLVDSIIVKAAPYFL